MKYNFYSEKNLEEQINYKIRNLKPEEKTINLEEITKRNLKQKYSNIFIEKENLYNKGYQKILNAGIKEENLYNCGLKIINYNNFSNLQRTNIEKIIFAELRLNITIYAYYETEDDYGIDMHYLLFEYNEPDKQTEEINTLFWYQDEEKPYLNFWWYKNTAKLHVCNYLNGKQEISKIKLIKNITYT